jgi:hypothetical protein
LAHPIRRLECGSALSDKRQSRAAPARASSEWPDFCIVAAGFAVHNPYSGTTHHIRRWANVMNSNNGMFGILIGGIVAIVAALFILSGGEFGGKKSVAGDQDLPPVAAEER